MKNSATLNHVYRLVWSRVQNAWIAVAETAKGRGKSATRRKLVLVALAAAPCFAWAGLDGGVIVGGQGTIVNPNLVIQDSARLAINAQGFGVAAGETFTLRQNLATDIALIRVLGQNPSDIFGNINANGQLFISNPNGVLFSRDAQVDVGGLVATTLNLSMTDFMNGSTTFSNSGSAGSVVNQGTLTAAQGGYIALLAPEVRNEGVISASMGTALLAAGDRITLNLNNNALVDYSIDQGTINALVDNKQLIQADGGQVFMGAKAADILTAAVVNNTGVIRARTVQNKAGVIELMGDMQTGTVNVGGTLDASAPAELNPDGGDGGFIETSAAHVRIADDVHIATAGVQGNSGITYKNGNWLIDPFDFTIAASGGDITGANLVTLLGSNNITITTQTTGALPNTLYGTTGTNGDIFVNDAVSWGSIYSLTLLAARDINVNTLVSNTGSGGFTATASRDVNLNAAVSVGGSISATATRDINVAADLTTGATGGLSLIAASGNVNNTGIINISGPVTFTSGTGNLTLTSGKDSGGAYVDLGNVTFAYASPGNTFGNVTLNKFNDINLQTAGNVTLAATGSVSINASHDITLNQDVNAGGSIAVSAVRDINLSNLSGNNLTTGAAGGLTLSAAGGNYSNEGSINIAGVSVLTSGTGDLSLTSGRLVGTNNYADLTNVTFDYASPSNTFGSFTLNRFNDINLQTAGSATLASTSSVNLYASHDLTINQDISATTALGLYAAGSNGFGVIGYYGVPEVLNTPSTSGLLALNGKTLTSPDLVLVTGADAGGVRPDFIWGGAGSNVNVDSGAADPYSFNRMILSGFNNVDLNPGSGVLTPLAFKNAGSASGLYVTNYGYLNTHGDIYSENYLLLTPFGVLTLAPNTSLTTNTLYLDTLGSGDFDTRVNPVYSSRADDKFYAISIGSNDATTFDNIYLDVNGTPTLELDLYLAAYAKNAITITQNLTSGVDVRLSAGGLLTLPGTALDPAVFKLGRGGTYISTGVDSVTGVRPDFTNILFDYSDTSSAGYDFGQVSLYGFNNIDLGTVGDVPIYAKNFFVASGAGSINLNADLRNLAGGDGSDAGGYVWLVGNDIQTGSNIIKTGIGTLYVDVKHTDLAKPTASVINTDVDNLGIVSADAGTLTINERDDLRIVNMFTTPGGGPVYSGDEGNIIINAQGDIGLATAITRTGAGDLSFYADADLSAIFGAGTGGADGKGAFWSDNYTRVVPVFEYVFMIDIQSTTAGVQSYIDPTDIGWNATHTAYTIHAGSPINTTALGFSVGDTITNGELITIPVGGAEFYTQAVKRFLIGSETAAVITGYTTTNSTTYGLPTPVGLGAYATLSATTTTGGITQTITPGMYTVAGDTGVVDALIDTDGNPVTGTNNLNLSGQFYKWTWWGTPLTAVPGDWSLNSNLTSITTGSGNLTIRSGSQYNHDAGPFVQGDAADLVLQTTAPTSAGLLPSGDELTPIIQFTTASGEASIVGYRDILVKETAALGNTSGKVSLGAGRDLRIYQDITGGAGSTFMLAAGNMIQTEAGAQLTATNLIALAGGGVNLSGNFTNIAGGLRAPDASYATNSVLQGGLVATGEFPITSASDLYVKSLDDTTFGGTLSFTNTGVTITPLAVPGPVTYNGLEVTNGGTVKLTTTGTAAIYVDAPINATNGSVELNSATLIGLNGDITAINLAGTAHLSLTALGGAITQGTGNLIADILNADANGAITLNGATNEFGNLGTVTTNSSGGSININDATNGLAIVGPVNSGTGTVTVTTTGGDLTVSGSVTGSKVRLLDTVAGNDIILDSGAVVTGTDTGDAVILAAGGDFINNAGATAVTASNIAGRWLIYSTSPYSDVFGDLDSANQAIWNASYTSLPPASVTQTGNRYLFTYRPTVTFTSTSFNKTYGQDVTLAPLPTQYSVGGIEAGVANAFTGDSQAWAFSGTPVVSSLGAAATANAGDYAININQTGVTALNGYQLAVPVNSGILTVDPALLTLSTADVTKVYNASTDMTGATGQGAIVTGGTLFNGDTLSGGTFAYTDKNVGIANKTVTVSGVTVNDNNGGNNYTVSYVSNTTSTITQADLNVAITANDKVYDANTSATLTGGTVTALGTDIVTLSGTGTGTFDTKNVGVNKTVTITGTGGYSLTGLDAANYNLVTNATATADITQSDLLLAITANDKIYDGNTTATLNIGPLSTVFGSDIVSVVGSGTGAFDTANIGINKTVSIASAYSLTGADAANYNLITNTTTTADIIAAVLPPQLPPLIPIPPFDPYIPFQDSCTGGEGYVRTAVDRFALTEVGSYELDASGTVVDDSALVQRSNNSEDPRPIEDVTVVLFNGGVRLPEQLLGEARAEAVFKKQSPSRIIRTRRSI